MSTINTNVSSLIAQRALQQNQEAENTSLERLSTGLRINSGADDPAGLIASEGLQSQQAGLTQAISNAQRATNIVGTAEGGLSTINSLLTQVQSLVSQSANSGGLSASETAANQLQVDSILDTINSGECGPVGGQQDHDSRRSGLEQRHYGCGRVYLD
jgi:flagellin